MLSELCVRRPVFATMLVMSLVVLGLFSFRDLGVDLFPKADPAQVNVQLRLPGASPDEMTSAVIMPMENALSGIAGIDQMTANVNAGGSANIQIRFVLEANLEDAANAVREKVAGAMRTVPPETLPPVVQKQDPDADPIMSVLLSSKTASLRTLTEIADKQVKRALEAVNGVGAVTMNGDRSREIHIVVDVEKLNAHGLSIEQVVNAIRQENVEIPGGTLEQGKWEVGLRTLGRFDATEQFNDVIVATVNGVPLRVSDIGYAEDGVKKIATSLFMADGSPGVQLDIRRASGENTITVIEGVKDKLDDVRETLPPDVTLTIPTDDSRFIYASIASLEEHLIWGSLLASLVVFFFIRNLRAVDHRLGRHPGVDHRHVHVDACHGLHAQQHDAARAHPGRRHRHRRRHRGAGEHLPLHRGEGPLALRCRHRGHARGRAAGDGHDAVAHRHLPASRLHDRLRAALHLPVRLDDGVRDSGIDGRQLHADADAQFPLAEGGARRRRGRHQAPPAVPRARSLVQRLAAVDARPPDVDHRRLGRAGRAHRPAELDGGAHVRAGRGHERVHRPRRHAAGHVDRRHGRDRP